MAEASSTEQGAADALVWAEPRGFRKSELKGSSRFMLRLLGVTACAAAVFLALVHVGGLGPEAYRALLAAAGAIMLLSLVVWACTRLSRMVVKVTPSGIEWDLGELPTVFPFRDIDHCRFSSLTRNGAQFVALVVALKSGDRECFGLAPTVAPEALRATLERHGVRVTAAADEPPAAADPITEKRQ